MKIYRCSVYKAHGILPPSESFSIEINDRCTLLISNNLNHIDIHYFRSELVSQAIMSVLTARPQPLNDSNDLDKRTASYREKFISTQKESCYLTVLTKFDIEENIEEPNREIGPYLVAAINAPPDSPSKKSHKNTVEAAISALSITSKDIDHAEKIFEATYRHHGERGIIHYCEMKGSVDIKVISPLPENFQQEFRSICVQLIGIQDFSSVFRLLSASHIQKNQKLSAFLSAWSALEIFINKSFPTQESKFFSSIDKPQIEFVSRMREVIKDKYRLTDKFSLLSAFIASETSMEDILLFKSIKKIRDELLHGAEIEINTLPLESTQNLLRRYLLLYVNAMQT